MGRACPCRRRTFRRSARRQAATQAAGRRPADRFDGCLAGEPAWRGWPHHIDRTDRRRSPAEAPGDGGFAGRAPPAQQRRPGHPLPLTGVMDGIDRVATMTHDHERPGGIVTAVSVVVAGGGTAGHIEPAMTSPTRFGGSSPSAEITALGTERGLDTHADPGRGATRSS